MKYFEDFQRISSPFGMRIHPITRKPSFHKGIDYVKGHDDPIYAVVGGLVTHARMGQKGSGLGNYGITVCIKDKNGALHLYAHLNSALVKEGRSVEQGQVIGRQGSTGQSTGSHLHYEIRKKASPNFGWEASENSVYEPIVYLENYFAKEKKEEPQIFPDVANDRWSIEEIKSAVQNGFMRGYPDGTFRPGQQVTREELACTLVRIMKLINS
jgi:murein DD-endopeptidase MepM/ murein hydrolase activator NlpD